VAAGLQVLAQIAVETSIKFRAKYVALSEVDAGTQLFVLLAVVVDRSGYRRPQWSASLRFARSADVVSVLSPLLLNALSGDVASHRYAVAEFVRDELARIQES
jgi:hypothetical protein